MHNYQEEIRSLLKDLNKRICCDSSIVHIYYYFLDEFEIPIAFGNIKYPLLKPIDRSVLLWKVINHTDNEYFSSNFEGDFYFDKSRFIKREGIQSSGFIKLFNGNFPIGILFINFENRTEFDDELLSTIKEYSDQIETLIRDNIPFYSLVTSLVKNLSTDIVGLQVIDKHNHERLYALEVGIEGLCYRRKFSIENILSICNNRNFKNNSSIPISKLAKRQQLILNGIYGGKIYFYKVTESVIAILYFGYGEKDSLIKDQTLQVKGLILDNFPQMSKFILESIHCLRSRLKIDNLIQTTSSLLNRYDDIEEVIHYYLFYSISLTGADAGRFILINRGGEYKCETIDNGNNKSFTVDKQFTQKIVKPPWNDVTSEFIQSANDQSEVSILGNQCKSKAIIPINDGRKMIGVLVLEYKTDRKFDHGYQELTSLIADYFKIPIIRSLQTEKISSINKIISEISNPNLEIELIYRKILNAIFDLTLPDIGSIAVVDVGERQIRDIININYDEKDIKQVKRDLDEQSICAWVYKNKEHALIRNFYKQPEWKEREYRINKNTISQLTIPIINIKDQGKIDAIINLESEYEDGFDERDLSNGKELARSASIALANIEKIRLLEDQNSRLNALYHAAEVLSKNQFEIEPILKTLLNESIKATRVEFGFIKLLENQKFHLEYTIPDYIKTKFARKQQREDLIENSIEALCIDKRKAIHRNKISVEDELLLSEFDSKETILSAPLISNDEIIGILTIGSGNKEFTDDDDALIDALIRLSMSGYENVKFLQQQEEMNRKKLIMFLNPINKISSEYEKMIKNMPEAINNPNEFKRLRGDFREQLDSCRQTIEKDFVDDSIYRKDSIRHNGESNLDKIISIAILRTKTIAEIQGVNIETNINDIKKTKCICDDSLLIHIFTNLILNAVKYSKKESKSILIRARNVGRYSIVSISNESDFIDKDYSFSEETEPQDQNLRVVDDLINVNRRILKKSSGDLWYETRKDSDKDIFTVYLKLEKK